MRRFHIFRIVLALTMMGLCFLSGAMPVWAVPPLPYSPYGTVTVNGAPAPDGMQVTAWINGVQYASTHTIRGYYALNVPGDDADSPGVIEGGVPGDTVLFKVNGYTATPTGTWASGASVVFNIAATMPTVARPLFLPLIRR